MRIRSIAAVLVIASCGHPAPATHPVPAPPPPDAAPAAAPDAAPVAAGPPVARTVDVVETLFGVTVADPYRWMEGDDNAELKTWLRAQGAHARAYLDVLPGRDALFKRIRELGLGSSRVSGLQLAGGRAFYELTAQGAQLPTLMVRDAKGERVLVDPAKLGAGDQHASVNNFAPSPDGSLLAYGVALGGGEISAIHLLDVATGAERPDVIEHVWGEFPVSWLPDGKAFFYTQMAPAVAGKDPMLDMTTRLHVLGTPVDHDVVVLARGVSAAMPIAPDEFPAVSVQPGTTWMVAIAGGAHDELRIAIAPLAKLDRTGGGKTPWRMVAEYADQVGAALPHGDRLYMETFKDASNHKLISVPLAAPVLAKARVEIAESPDVVLQGFAVARDALYAREMIEGRARFVRLPWQGKAAPVTLPYDGWIDEFAADPLRDGATIDLVSWTKPDAYFAIDRAGKTAATPLATTSNADFSNVAVDEVEATSADGTKVPLTILRAKDLAADGSHPALVYGYGGYGISINPFFAPPLLAWLERGGVYAVCHVRGGGEKGRQWRDDGTHEHKMNGVHDFEACGQALIDRKLTTGARLFGRAGSMGGILIGRAITDRPDLFAAVNIAVGEDNPVRLLAAENGADQKSELGDPETEAGFKSILAMDPYQHVAPSTAYPAVIFTIGLNDKRVAPWMTGKMAAKMLASTSSKAPILVRIDEDAGHGIGSTRDQSFAETADVDAFFLSIAGDKDFQPR